MKAISINPLCSDSDSSQTSLPKRCKANLLGLSARLSQAARLKMTVVRKWTVQQNFTVLQKHERAMIQPMVRVSNGIHTGAEAPMVKNSMFLVGRALDCDLVLNDADIAPHHCLISFIHGQFQVRALEGALKVKNTELNAGGQCLLAAGSTVCLADVSLQLVTGRESVPFVKTLLAWGRRHGMNLLRLSKARPLFALATLIGFITLSAGLLNYSTAKATAELDANKLPSTSAGSMTANPYGLSEDGTYMPGIKDGSIKNLAKDVAEIMRLSGIPVQAKNLGEGIVEVQGYFGQPDQLDQIIQSRAIADIKGLQKIKMINLSNEAPQAPSKHISIKRISGGADPYVVTSDGAIYYPGAKLSSGFEVAGINQLLVRLQHPDGTVHHLRVGQKFE